MAKTTKKMLKKPSVGMTAFYTGLILAVIIAIFQAYNPSRAAVAIIGILGIIVGLLNIKDTEVQPFMIAAIAFLLSFGSLSTLAMDLFGWQAIATFFGLLNAFIAPATAIVALREIYEITRGH